MRYRRREVGDAAVDDDRPVRMGGLQLVDEAVVERRNRAVFPGAEAVEQRLSRMNDQRRRAGRLHGRRDGAEGFARRLLVDADAALHRDRNPDRADHRGDAFADQLRLAHQAGAEASALHPVRRTAAVEIDLIVAEFGADARRLGEALGIGPAELQRDWMLRRIEAEQPLAGPKTTASAVTISV